MKKILYFLMPFLCAGLAGCSDDYTPADGGIEKIESTDLNFTAAGGEGSITVDGFGWISAVSSQEWCEVRVEGMTVHVTVAESQEPTSRSAVVTISADGKSVEVPVVQAGALVTLYDNELSHVFDYDGGTFTFSFESTTGYIIEIPEDAKSWISYVEDTEAETSSENEKHLIFTVAANEAEAFRGAEILFSTGGRNLSLSVMEMSADDIAGTWDCSYESALMGSVVSGSVEVSATGMPGVFSMPDLIVSSQIPGIYIPLTWMPDGKLGVVGGTDVYHSMVITVVAAGEGLYSNLTCLATPSYENGNLVYRFGNYVDEVTGLPIYAFCLYMLTDGSPLDIYYNFTITKQIQ